MGGNKCMQEVVMKGSNTIFPVAHDRQYDPNEHAIVCFCESDVACFCYAPAPSNHPGEDDMATPIRANYFQDPSHHGLAFLTATSNLASVTVARDGNSLGIYYNDQVGGRLLTCAAGR